MQYKKFSKDLQRKFLLIGIVPTLVVSAFLFAKIYFIFEDISIKSHEKVLKDIHFNIDQLLEEIDDETSFMQKNFQSIDIERFIRANDEVETVLIFDRNKQKAINLVSDFNVTKKIEQKYLQQNPFSIYKDIKKSTFNTMHKAITQNRETISYVIPTKDYIFVFDVNLTILEDFIDYLKKSIDYIILIVDKDGNYIYKSDERPYYHDNFFKTEYYNKVVKEYEPLEYVEFFNEEQDVDNFMVYFKSDDTGWTLVTIEDYDSLDDKVLALLPYVVVLIPIIILIIMILARKFTDKIVTPLEILIKKMEKLSNMSDVQKIPLENIEYSLFKRIIDSFNIMQDKIYHREQELKYSNELLYKKTKEITAFNENLQERIAKEIENNRKKDQQMLQQSRLAQMGEMMSMIAHQWRQPLAAISSASIALNMKARLNKLDKDAVVDITTKISDYSQHLSTTIDDFREFFKVNKEKKETSFKELVESVLSIVEISLKNKNITLEENFQSRQIFNTYPNELKQVILNLIKNAEDVLIERDIQNPKIIIETEDNILRVIDNAGGIPEDIIDKIFDPYFSTKTKKDGTGLGLYMSKTIVEEHCNGILRVYNNEMGACFEIIL